MNELRPVMKQDNPISLMPVVPVQLKDKDFYRISSFIEKNTGIRMPETKKMMIQARLLRRLKLLNFTNFSDYIDYVFSSGDKDEIISMTDVLTTNLTEFFREKEHFNVMMKTVLPSLSASGVARPSLWSAGCSTGEEAYTLSIVMQEYIRQRPGKFSGYDILATDISTRVIDEAEQGIYPVETVEKLSDELKRRYFLRSRPDSGQNLVRIKPATRDKVIFRHLNFMDTSYQISDSKNIIFCRNVLIYFNKQIQSEVIQKLLQHLDKGGFLFLGHSETILGMNLPLEPIAPTVYRKKGD